MAIVEAPGARIRYREQWPYVGKATDEQLAEYLPAQSGGISSSKQRNFSQFAQQILREQVVKTQKATIGELSRKVRNDEVKMRKL
jgi:hypothetical protein